MIRTRLEIVNGEEYTRCTITGSDKVIYNDFRALLNMIYSNERVADIFIDAWDNIQEVKKN